MNWVPEELAMQHVRIEERLATPLAASVQTLPWSCASCGRLQRRPFEAVAVSGALAAETCRACGEFLVSRPADRSQAFRAVVANHLI